MKNRKNNSLRIFIVFILIIIGVIWFLNSKDTPTTNIINSDQTGYEASSLCFYRVIENDNGFYDIAWLRANILDNKINGEFYNLPSETDSKIGSFEGQIIETDSENQTIESNVWWSSLAEGMEIKEELIIKIKENSATVAFGEKIDKGDGVYVYKNKNDVFYIEEMPKINCDILDEKFDVENYVKENIKSIINDEEVLGGTWYVVSVFVNPLNNQGEIVYEDGHIQNKAEFKYSYQSITREITIDFLEVLR